MLFQRPPQMMSYNLLSASSIYDSKHQSYCLGKMNHSSVEDFQRLHDLHSSVLSDKSASRRTSLRPQDSPMRSIEHDYDDAASVSGSAPQSSGPDEAVFDHPLSHHSSPRTSHHSDDDESISSFFPGSREDSFAPEKQPSSPYTPLKMRSPFRNPSSVCAMQMETTPPPHIPLSSSQSRGMFPTPSRRGTPKSTRSAHSGMRMSPSKMSPSKRTNVKKEYPLVLLHVTLLPVPRIYSPEVMEQVLPAYILENWKVLREKATDTVLERGVLIPHPKEDYDLLEERLLESLDLKLPRILKCGHFHLDADEDADAAGFDEKDYDDEDNDADICGDCGRRVRDDKYGSGTGSRRWDIKVYAANGLMRAGAWGAAWREMERVDVEIVPWMDDQVKRELTLRTEEERNNAAFLQQKTVAKADQGSTMDEERMREIYGGETSAFADQQPEQASTSPARQPDYQNRVEIPLQDLLKNYLLAAAQDRKNIAIFVLSIFVLYMSFMASGSKPALPLPVHPPLATSLSSLTPASVSTSNTAVGISTTQETSVIEPLESSTDTSSPDGTADRPPAAPLEMSTGDPTDTIEAQFDLIGE
ncbi:MAG: hypothetical protein Q9183_000719 [Haloplaca sp. 2 TL-2023]